MTGRVFKHNNWGATQQPITTCETDHWECRTSFDVCLANQHSVVHCFWEQINNEVISRQHVVIRLASIRTTYGYRATSRYAWADRCYCRYSIEAGVYSSDSDQTFARLQLLRFVSNTAECRERQIDRSQSSSFEVLDIATVYFKSKEIAMPIKYSNFKNSN